MADRQLPCFDVVFLDAVKENTAADVAAWYPLVCEGGTLAGHDYRFPFDDSVVTTVHSIGPEPVFLGPDWTWWIDKPRDSHRNA